MIQTKELIYEYEKRDEEGNIIGMKRAIDGVDIDIPGGGLFVAILGHNGSGKSTLAKHMNAILVPSGGTMWVNGRDTKDPEKKQELLNQMWRNRCINDTYEPGSTFKIITSSACLEAGVVKLDDTFQCPGYRIGGGSKDPVSQSRRTWNGNICARSSKFL